MKHAMADLPLPTPAQARKIWESMQNPSTRRVARKLRQAGLPVSHMTVSRWRARGWRSAAWDQHPLEAARAALDDAVPLLTGDPMTKVKDLIEKHEKRTELEAMNEDQLLGRAMKETLVGITVASMEVQRQFGDCLPSKLGELANLLLAVGQCLKASADAHAQLAALQRTKVR
jgi:hypothetical protein